MKRIVCFGEIMARFSPPERQRLRQAMPGHLEVTFAGAEANVAAAIALLGGRSEFVTALPTNPLGEACVAALRATGVGVEHIVRRDEGRLGLYFVEAGANQRGGLVIYDRDDSSYALTGAGSYPWARILDGAGGLHVSGIAAGVSSIAAEATLAAVTAARKAGLLVSCDMNFRRKLWRWDPELNPADLARKTMRGIIPQVDLLIGNPHDLADVINAQIDNDLDVATDGGLAACMTLASELSGYFPKLRWVAMSLRRNHSASCNSWGSLLLRVHDGAVFQAPVRDGTYKPYRIESIVDRVGTGDAFAGALLFALQTLELAAPEKALAFATAAGCLAHSIQGDFSFCTRAEVEALMGGADEGYVSR